MYLQRPLQKLTLSRSRILGASTCTHARPKPCYSNTLVCFVEVGKDETTRYFIVEVAKRSAPAQSCRGDKGEILVLVQRIRSFRRSVLHAAWEEARWSSLLWSGVDSSPFLRPMILGTGDCVFPMRRNCKTNSCHQIQTEVQTPHSE